jgi:hypothetical protein
MAIVSTDPTKIQAPARRRFARLLPSELEATVQRVISTLFELQEVPDLNPHEAREAAEHTVEHVTKSPLDAYIATRQALLASRAEIRNGLVKLPDPGAMRVIEVHGWQLALIDEAKDDEPRVGGTVLGERLGYGDKPGARVRELVKRLEKEGELSGVFYVRESRKQSTGNGASREIEVDEPYLTEVQTVIVVMHVRTATAKALRQEIARVFVEANKLRRQQAQPQIQPNTGLALVSQVFQLAQEQRQELQSLREMVMRLLQPAQSHGVIGRRGAQEIAAALQAVARLEMGTYPESVHSKKLLKSCRGRADQELRQYLGFSGSGSTFSNLTFEQLGRAQMKLSEMAQRYRRLAGEMSATRQLTLV